MSTENPADVEALKARVAELEQQRGKRRFDGRGFSAWTVFLVAAILFPLALTAFWGQRTLTDTERYVATVAPLADDPTIQTAVATTVSNALIKQIDAQNRVTTLLADYPKLALLAGPIATGVDGFVQREVGNFMASDAFSSLWRGINLRAQQALIKALSGDPTGAVTIQGDQVILDTGDLIAVVKQRLVDRGLTFVANVPVPPIADRQVVLLTSSQLKTARTAYAIGQPVAQWLLYVVLLLFVVAILVSRRRARMIMATGIALMIGAALLKVGMWIGQDQLNLTLQGTPFALAEQAFWSILTTFLLGAVRVTFVLGSVLALVGWFMSGNSGAVAARTAVSGMIGGAGARAADGPLGEVGAWVARTRTFWRAAIVGVALLTLLLNDQLTGAVILWTALLAVLAFAAVEFLSAAGGGRAPVEAPATEPTEVPSS